RATREACTYSCVTGPFAASRSGWRGWPHSWGGTTAWWASFRSRLDRTTGPVREGSGRSHGPFGEGPTHCFHFAEGDSHGGSSGVVSGLGGSGPARAGRSRGSRAEEAGEADQPVERVGGRREVDERRPPLHHQQEGPGEALESLEDHRQDAE